MSLYNFNKVETCRRRRIRTLYLAIHSLKSFHFFNKPVQVQTALVLYKVSCSRNVWRIRGIASTHSSLSTIRRLDVSFTPQPFHSPWKKPRQEDEGAEQCVWTWRRREKPLFPTATRTLIPWSISWQLRHWTILSLILCIVHFTSLSVIKSLICLSIRPFAFSLASPFT
jgi:hypothetical protein